MFSSLLLTPVTMKSSFAPLLSPVCSSVARPLPLRTAVQTLFHIPISYAEWLIPIPPLSSCGSCNITKSALRSTPVSSGAMFQVWDLAQLCWTALIIGGSGSHFDLDLPHGLGHHHVSLRFGPLLLPCTICVFVGHWLPSFVSHTPCLAGAVYLSVGPCHSSRGCLSCEPYFPALLGCPGGFSLLRASVTERNMISFAVGALLQGVTAE